MDLIQGILDGHDAQHTATASAVSSLGLEDAGCWFLQCQKTGIWMWSQVCLGCHVCSVCDYILMDPGMKILLHRIHQVARCSTEH